MGKNNITKMGDLTSFCTIPLKKFDRFMSLEILTFEILRLRSSNVSTVLFWMGEAESNSVVLRREGFPNLRGWRAMLAAVVNPSIGVVVTAVVLIDKDETMDNALGLMLTGEIISLFGESAAGATSGS